MRGRGNTPSSFWKVSTALTPKPRRDTSRKLVSWRPWWLLKEETLTQSQHHVKRILRHTQVRFILRAERWLCTAKRSKLDQQNEGDKSHPFCRKGTWSSLLAFVYNYFIKRCVCVCEGQGVRGQLSGMGLHFCHMGPRNWIHVVRLGGEHLYPPRDFAGPSPEFHD